MSATTNSAWTIGLPILLACATFASGCKQASGKRQPPTAEEVQALYEALKDLEQKNQAPQPSTDVNEAFQGTWQGTCYKDRRYDDSSRRDLLQIDGQLIVIYSELFNSVDCRNGTYTSDSVPTIFRFEIGKPADGDPKAMEVVTRGVFHTIMRADGTQLTVPAQFPWGAKDPATLDRSLAKTFTRLAP